MLKRRSFAASLLLSLPGFVAAGKAIVKYNCGSTPMYFASVGESYKSLSPLPAGGYSEAYSEDEVGISIKLSPDPQGDVKGDVTQFEFTWTSDGRVAYDISNINGNPFSQGGILLTPSAPPSEQFPTCVVVDCPAGQATCDAAYNQPDDVRTKVCPDTADLTFTVCASGGPPAAAAPAESSAAPAEGSAAAPASGQTPADHDVQDQSGNQAQGQGNTESQGQPNNQAQAEAPAQDSAPTQGHNQGQAAQPVALPAYTRRPHRRNGHVVLAFD